MADGAIGQDVSPRTDDGMALPTSPETRTPVIVVTGPGRNGKAAMFSQLTSDPALVRVVVVKDSRGSGLSADQPPPDGGAGLGCVCCAVQGGLQRSLRAFLPRTRRGEISHIVVDAAETADPLAILTTLIADPVLAAVYRIGGVVAVVDRQDIRDMTELTRRQVTLADGIIVSDADDAASAPRVLNPVARIAWGLPDSRFLLTEERFGAPCLMPGEGATVLDVTIAPPLDWAAVSRWLSGGEPRGDSFSRSNGCPAQRVTGILRIAGEPRPVAVDTVRHRLAPPRLLSAWPDGQPPQSRLIFMGDGLDAASIAASVRGCAVRSPAASG